MEKKYEEALERARMEYNADVTQGTKNVLETIFPELKESEDDGIRKEIIDIVKSQKEQQCHIDGAVYDKMIAWLEKQGEQEEPQVYETEYGEVITYSESEGYKVAEPKFHEGDWIYYSKAVFGGVMQIAKIDEKGYCVNKDGAPYGIIPFEDEILMRHWTIQDEKPTDKVESKFKVDN